MKRIYHTWDKWECYRAGFFEVRAPKGFSDEQCEGTYRELLSDVAEFKRVMQLIVAEWPNSCEHNLTNERMNRVAWMGQAAVTYKYKVPARFKGGYNLLTDEQKQAADNAALEVINEWMDVKGYERLETTMPKTEVNLY
jgi:hypothetical protein